MIAPTAKFDLRMGEAISAHRSTMILYEHFRNNSSSFHVGLPSLAGPLIVQSLELRTGSEQWKTFPGNPSDGWCQPVMYKVQKIMYYSTTYSYEEKLLQTAKTFIGYNITSSNI